MTNLVAKYAAKKMLRGQMDKYKSKEVTNYDPYYDIIDHPTRPGKTKKVKKQVPAYIPEHDANILANMRKRAYALDCSLFNLFGIRFGWSSVLGIVPAAGDALDAGLAALLVWRCTKISCGLGQAALLRMLINVFIDFIVGLVPFIGDIADAGFKANSRNVRVLEERLDAVYMPAEMKAARKAKKGGKPMPPATVYEDFSDEESLPMYDRQPGTGEPRRQELRRDEPRRPEEARVPRETRGGERTETRKGGLFSSGSRREERRPDVEMAQTQNPSNNPSREPSRKSRR